jgi:hypothetical protein
LTPPEVATDANKMLVSTPAITIHATRRLIQRP